MRATGIVRRIDDLGRVVYIFLINGKNIYILKTVMEGLINK